MPFISLFLILKFDVNAATPGEGYSQTTTNRIRILPKPIRYLFRNSGCHIEHLRHAGFLVPPFLTHELRHINCLAITRECYPYESLIVVCFVRKLQ